MADYKVLLGAELRTKDIDAEVKKYNGKVTIGVNPDGITDGITAALKGYKASPIRLGVELDPNGIQNVQNQIDDLRQRIQNIGNPPVNIGGNGGGNGGRGRGRGGNNGGNNNNAGNAGNGNGGAGNGGNGGGNGGVGGGQVREITEAYNRLMRVLRELASIRKQLSTTNSLENPELVRTLTAQIETLEQQYGNMMDSIRQRQIQFTADQQSRMRTLIDSTNRKLDANQSKAQDNFIAENQERAYERLLSTLEGIHSLEQNIAKLRNQGGNNNQITELEGQLDNLMTTYQNLMDIMSRNLTPEQWESLDTEVAEANNEMTLLQAKYQDVRNTLAAGIGESVENLTFDKEVKEINSNFGRLSTQSDDARESVKQLNQALADMKTASAQGNIEALIEANERYAQSLRTAKNQIAMQQRDEKDFAFTYKDDIAELEAVADKIDKIRIRIAGLDKTSNSNEISVLTSELKELEDAYQKLSTKLQGKLSPEQLSSIAESAIETEEALKRIAAQLEDTKAKLANKINIKLANSDNGLSQFDNEIDAVTTKYNRLSNKDIPELQHAMDELSSAFNRLKETSKTGTYDELIQANKEYEAALKAVKAQLDINTRAEQEAAADQKLTDDRIAFQSKVDAWLTKNSAAAKKFGSDLIELKAQAENCDRTTLNHLEREFKQIDKAAEAAGVRTKTFGDSLKAQFEKYRSYFSVASLFMYGEQALRSMFEQVKLIDSAMTELKKVTNETDDAYNQFLGNAAKRARVLGTTVDGIISSTADFARLGYGFEESQGLAEVANIYAVVGDEIEGVEDATQSLVSTLAAFRSDMGDMSNTDFAMSIVDKMNEVSNNFAISSGGIGQALQRSASSMAAANNTLDETIAMITAANEIAQNPEKVGNAMKTKFLYNCLNVQKCA